jgi:hypothetical protein
MTNASNAICSLKMLGLELRRTRDSEACASQWRPIQDPKSKIQNLPQDEPIISVAATHRGDFTLMHRLSLFPADLSNPFV